MRRPNPIQGRRPRRASRWVWAIPAALAAGLAVAAVRWVGSSAAGRVATRPGSPVYRATGIFGNRITFPDGRPTLVYFMAAWCSSCWQGESALVPLWRQLRDRAIFVSLDVTPQLDSPSSIALMAQRTGAGWPQAYATPALLNRFHIAALDTVVVLSPTGKVLYEGPTPGNPRLARLLHATVRPGPSVSRSPNAQGLVG